MKMRFLKTGSTLYLSDPAPKLSDPVVPVLSSFIFSLFNYVDLFAVATLFLQ